MEHYFSIPATRANRGSGWSAAWPSCTSTRRGFGQSISNCSRKAANRNPLLKGRNRWQSVLLDGQQACNLLMHVHQKVARPLTTQTHAIAVWHCSAPVRGGSTL